MTGVAVLDEVAVIADWFIPAATYELRSANIPLNEPVEVHNPNNPPSLTLRRRDVARTSGDILLVVALSGDRVEDQLCRAGPLNRLAVIALAEGGRARAIRDQRALGQLTAIAR